MITMVDIAPEHYNAIGELIKAGKYPSIETFAEVAIRNQLMLERSQSGRSYSVKAIVDKQATHSIESLKKPFNQEPILVEPVALAESRRITPIWGLINRFTPSKV